jgi:CheY-like chemotaxis protein
LEVFQNPLLAIQHIEDLLTTKEGRESLPNIIFLDLNMPEMNGSEVLRILKEKKALRTIPIIIVTTSSLEEDIVKCYDLHANSVMIKPMDFDDYVHMLEITLKYWLYVYYSVK